MTTQTEDQKRWEAAESAQTAIFLWQGFMDVVHVANPRTTVPKDQALYDSHFDGLGQDGGGLSVAYVAVGINAEYNARWTGQQDFPGVYHYEITETLGAWWAKEGPKLHDFQYGEERRKQAMQAVLNKYNELMAAWFVTEKLIG